jgi:hypothetical protein
MKPKRWRVVLWVAFVLRVFCAVRDVRRSAASNGAQRIEVRAGRAPSDEKETDARFKKALESKDENDAKAANELPSGGNRKPLRSTTDEATPDGTPVGPDAGPSGRSVDEGPL